MLDAFGFDPTLHEALVWSVIDPTGKRWDRTFKSRTAAWRTIGLRYGYRVVPIAWKFKSTTALLPAPKAVALSKCAAPVPRA